VTLLSGVQQGPCPRRPIFPTGACRVLPGILYIAFGPCNSDDAVPALTAENSLPVLDWLQVMGLDQVQIDGQAP